VNFVANLAKIANRPTAISGLQKVPTTNEKYAVAHLCYLATGVMPTTGTVAAISVRYLAVYLSPTDRTRGLNIRGKKYEKGKRNGEILNEKGRKGKEKEIGEIKG
jgi:hypothetical protein